MHIMAIARTASIMVSEMREFAGFEFEEQRYISCALDIGLARRDAIKPWASDDTGTAAIRRQYVAYEELASLRGNIPESGDIEGAEVFLCRLVRLIAFDLGRERIESFSALRFLYERLLGANVRPWLPSAFCAAAALPQIRPGRRKLLLQSLSEAAATAPGWSQREPQFFPDFVDVEAA